MSGGLSITLVGDLLLIVNVHALVILMTMRCPPYLSILIGLNQISLPYFPSYPLHLFENKERSVKNGTQHSL
jgi:hypothetical protein